MIEYTLDHAQSILNDSRNQSEEDLILALVNSIRYSSASTTPAIKGFGDDVEALYGYITKHLEEWIKSYCGYYCKKRESLKKEISSDEVRNTLLIVNFIFQAVKDIGIEDLAIAGADAVGVFTSIMLLKSGAQTLDELCSCSE